VLAFITFILLATFPGWHVETNQEGSDVDVKPFPKRAVSQAALAFVFIAAVFVLVRLPYPSHSPLLQYFGVADIPHPSGFGTVATHSICCRRTNSARFRERQCDEWCRVDGDDLRLVRVRAVGDSDDRAGGDDLDGQVAE